MKSLSYLQENLVFFYCYYYLAQLTKDPLKRSVGTFIALYAVSATFVGAIK